jgi:hypothetical protein
MDTVTPANPGTDGSATAGIGGAAIAFGGISAGAGGNGSKGGTILPGKAGRIKVIFT